MKLYEHLKNIHSQCNVSQLTDSCSTVLQLKQDGPKAAKESYRLFTLKQAGVRIPPRHENEYLTVYFIRCRWTVVIFSHLCNT